MAVENDQRSFASDVPQRGRDYDNAGQVLSMHFATLNSIES